MVRDVPPAVPDQPLQSEVYWSNRQAPRAFSYFIVRTTVPPASMASSIRERLRTIDRDLDATNLQPMPQLIRRELRTPRFQVLLLLTFSATALALAAIGTYGLFAYAVTRRSRELGIRIALGAQPRQILAAVIGDALKLASLGVVVGTGCALVLVRAVRGMIVGVSPFDPVSIAGSALPRRSPRSRARPGEARDRASTRRSRSPQSSEVVRARPAAYLRHVVRGLPTVRRVCVS